MARYLKKKEKSPRTLLWLLGVLIAVILLGMLVLTGRTKPLNTNMVVETPYCILSYPDKWSSRVRIKITESPVYCVSYFAVLSQNEEIKLFDITFGEEYANPTGWIELENGEMISVCASAAAVEPDESQSEEWNIVQEMMDDLNYTLERIPFTTFEEETERTESAVLETMPMQDIIIDTPYGQLVYPGKWQGHLNVTNKQNEDYTVSFQAVLGDQNLQPLFDIVFSDNGELGMLSVNGNEIGVSVVLHPVSTQNEILSSMQEDVNFIIERMDLSKNSVVTNSVDEPNMDTSIPVVTTPLSPQEENFDFGDMVLETPYGQLRYPGKWSSMVVTETTETDVYLVAFFATVGSHERIHLFTVCFGDDPETAIGTVKDVQGHSLTFSIVSSQATPGKTWTKEEKNYVYEMMEDVNYLIDALLGK